MVMHARKLPRINDGYYDRHQGHSSYQNSKYGSSSSSSKGLGDRYGSDRGRSSPGGNSSSRSNSVERGTDPSPRSRSYGNKGWYHHRLHENDRDRSYHRNDSRESSDALHDSERDRNCHQSAGLRQRSRSRVDHDRGHRVDADRDSRRSRSNECDSETTRVEHETHRTVDDAGRESHHEVASERRDDEKAYLERLAASSTRTDHERPSYRDYHRNNSRGSSSSKDRDRQKSPNDRRPLNKESVHTNHDRNSFDKCNSNKETNGSDQSHINVMESQYRKSSTGGTADKRNEKSESQEQSEKAKSRFIMQCGDWSLYLSTSGKKYYYNSRTEVSQWGKPRGWMEPDNGANPNLSSSSTPPLRTNSDKHSTVRPQVNDTHRDFRKHPVQENKDRINNSNWSNKDTGTTYRDEQCFVDQRSQDNSIPSSTSAFSEQNQESSSCKEMDICSGNSTPVWENCAVAESDKYMIHEQMQRISLVPHQPLYDNQSSPNVANGLEPSSIVSPLSRTLLEDVKPEVDNLSHSSMQFDDSGPSVADTGNSVGPLIAINSTNISPDLKMEPDQVLSDGGPPTPTHSEQHDEVEPSNCPTPETATTQSSSVFYNLFPSFSDRDVPQINPGLNQFVRNDLTTHMRNWPAEEHNKLADKLMLEYRTVHGIRLTDTLVDLKILRSKSRYHEIHNTILEQRVLQLRDEIKTLENIKTPSLFNMDDSDNES